MRCLNYYNIITASCLIGGREARGYKTLYHLDLEANLINIAIIYGC